MSKKSRKKSPKTSPQRKATAKSAKAAKKVVGKAVGKAVKTKGKKTGAATANNSGKKRTGQASHKAASKQLKSSSPPAASKRRSAAATSEGHPMLAEGAKAPSFHLPRDGGGMIALSDFAGKKLVLFFYPRADTPGCTREAIDFTRLKGAFAESGTEVLGISADSLKAQESFRDKHKLAVPLISDEKHQMLEAYGAWGEKSMYGKTFLGILRTTVLIDRDARVTRVWRRVKVDGHADAVLAAAKALH
jgi:peroxiredoxin Q/BCP